MPEHGHSTGHGFEHDVGESFTQRWHYKEIHRLVIALWLRLKANHMNSTRDRAGLRAIEHLLVNLAAFADDDKFGSGKFLRKPFERSHEWQVALERVEATYHADDRPGRMYADFATSGFGWVGCESFSIDAVEEDFDFFRGHPELDQFVVQTLRNGMHALAGAIEHAALTERLTCALRLRKAVFAMKNVARRAHGSGKGSIDQRAKVVCVDDVGFDFGNNFGQRENRSPREAGLFVENVNVVGFGQTFDKCPTTFETGGVNFELFWVEAAGDIDNAIFHAARFQGKNDVENFEAALFGHADVWNKERDKSSKLKLQTSEKIRVSRSLLQIKPNFFRAASNCALAIMRAVLQPTSTPPSEFDRYAANYDEALAKGISVSGEDKDFFARGRVEWLARRLKSVSFEASSILDFGCGTGSATPHLSEVLKPHSVTGVDISEQSVALARKRFESGAVSFEVLRDFKPDSRFDLAFCNGVFHHIPLNERASAVKCVFSAVRPGGYFAFWENNPWNPGTRYVMNRIPFDRDAIMVSAPEARRLLSAGGFEVLRTDFLFIFPRVLSWLRGLEPSVSRLPLGAQYQVLCRKAK